MPIQLTTAFNPGDLDNTTYQQVKIPLYITDVLGKNLQIIYQYGNTIDGVWQPGQAGPRRQVTVTGQDYIDIIAELAEENETVYEAVSRILYQYLLDKEIVAGTIV